MNKELKEWLDEYWVDPIVKQGFTYEDYGHKQFKDSGVHILHFESNLSKVPSVLKDILTQDDDNQPEATYTFYFGTLFVFIPYFQ